MAVLIDAENISYRYAKIILDEASNYGPLIYKRIYGDWSSPTMAPWRNLILNYSIQPIQQFANTRGKNATDSALIIDAMDLLHAGKQQGFCIVSSDSDFTRLAARLRESEMLVVGMGEKKTPASFISACDRFHYLDVLLSERIRSSNAQKAAATGFGEQTNAAAADDSDVKSGRDKAEVAKATPHNAIKEKNGEQPTRKQLEALLNLFARQQQIKPSDRVCQRGSDLPMRAGYSLLQFAFASLGIVSFGIEAGASKPQRHVRLWHEPKISHARAA